MSSPRTPGYGTARALVRALAAALVLTTPRFVRAAPGAPDELVPPRLVVPTRLEYPAELADGPDPPRGEIIVKFTVGTDGIPKEAVVERSLHPLLDQLALESVRGLRYEPGRWKGRPVEVTLRIGLSLEPPAPPAPPIPAPAPAGPAAPGPAPAPAPAPATEAADPTIAAPSTTVPATPQGPPQVRGELLQAGQRTPIGGAAILVVPAPPGLGPGRIRKKLYDKAAAPAWSQRTVSDAAGRFELAGLPPGLVRIVVLTQGFERLDYVERIAEGEEISVRYFQTPLSTNPYRTVVRASREEREEVARRTISTQEINNLPGTQGDALKSIQNFPGIARSPFGIGLLVIRGSSPQDSAVFLGMHEIPQLYHFGGLTSVFNSDILTQIDFIPGNFDSRYGDAIGGVINVAPRKGRRDGYHGYLDSDLFDTGVLFEGPIKKGSFILSARRSYIDLLLPALIPKDAGIAATVAPRYWDYQALFDYPVGGGELSVRVFGSDDRTKLLFAEENQNADDVRNKVENVTFFHRADAVYRKVSGPWEFLVTPSYRHDFFRVRAGDLFNFNFFTDAVFGRAEISRSLTTRHSVRMGTETVAGVASIDAEAPPVPTDGGGTPDGSLRTESRVPFATPALYTTFSLAATDRLTFYPGVRLQYYTAPFYRATVDPRLRAAWQIADRTILKGAAGLYSQAPSIVEWNPTWGNPRLSPERSAHLSLGVSQEFDYGLSLEVTGFYKRLWDLSTSSDRIVTRPDGSPGPESFASVGTGRIYGGELLARKNVGGSFFGWISYTIMRSERKKPGEDWTLFDFDQTHILTLIAVYKLPKQWQIGARFRLVSGNPTTPVLGAVYDSAADAFLPINGRYNSDRLPMFHQLDLRVDKRWIWRRVMLNAYLDILNAYNHQNTELWNYSYDYRTRQRIPSLPIIPSVGLKVEF